MSSIFEGGHEIRNEAYAENLSFLSHWEPKRSHMWASISEKTVPLCKLLGMNAFNFPNNNVMGSVIDNYKLNLRKNMRFAGSTCLRTLTSEFLTPNSLLPK